MAVARPLAMANNSKATLLRATSQRLCHVRPSTAVPPIPSLPTWTAYGSSGSNSAFPQRLAREGLTLAS
jgi:hypothetical protein